MDLYSICIYRRISPKNILKEDYSSTIHFKLRLNFQQHRADSKNRSLLRPADTGTGQLMPWYQFTKVTLRSIMKEHFLTCKI